MYNYKLLNNHYVVKIGENHFIIDTGFPWSVTFKSGLSRVNIDGNIMDLQNPTFFGFDIKKTHKLVGYAVDGLLGADAFRKTGLTIYKDNEEGGRIDFASHDINGSTYPMVALTNNDSTPFIKTDDGKLYLVDTGARYGYGAKAMFNGLNSVNTVWDYNPMLGDLYSNIYNVDVHMNNKKCHTTACYNIRVTFNIPDFLMVGNITDFFEKECCINYQAKKIIFN